jgi:putative spermidine/putrescine transport system permease protein
MTPRRPGRERLVRLAMLAPAVGGIGGLFVAGLALAALRTVGIAPFGGVVEPSLDAWVRAASEPGLVASLTVSLFVAISATALSVTAGTGLALALDRATRAGRAAASRRLLETLLAVPHVVAAVGMAALLSQSGLVARLAFSAGLITEPADMPALVQDRFGIGMIATFAWKESAFVAAVVSSVLLGRDGRAEAVARTLGATPAQAFRHVTLPAILPAVGAAAALVFAYVLGSWEVPAILSASHPQPVPLLAVALFTSSDVDDRPAAVALSLLLAAIGFVMLAAWRRLSRLAPPVPPA